jgi:hypothetical protein
VDGATGSRGHVNSAFPRDVTYPPLLPSLQQHITIYIKELILCFLNTSSDYMDYIAPNDMIMNYFIRMYDECCPLFKALY